MATVHTDLPRDASGHHGEYVVGQTLSKFSNPGLEIWFDVNYIAGVTDLDLILLDNQVGYFVIEVKSMKIDAIKEFTWSSLVLHPDQKRQHPVVQLRNGSLSLRGHLKKFPQMRAKGDIPFIQSTVLWSEITRKEWKSRFDRSEVLGFEEMCIFKDDLESYNKFVISLQRLWEKPILGVRAPNNARSTHGSIDAFRQALKPEKHKIVVSTAMADELKRPAKESKGVAEKYEPGKKHMVSIQGAPGTGKTTVLREIGLSNLAAGGQVLYVCFNKVLAADQKREFQLLRKNVEDYGFIDVFDVWELYKALGHEGGLRTEKRILENVETYLASDEGKKSVKYDVILVDESQDLTQTLFEVLEKVARPATSWFIAYGKGQELQNLDSEDSSQTSWLANFLLKATPEHRRRSFRNSPKAFLIAQSFWEKYSDISQAKEWITEKFKQQSPDDPQFELDLGLPQTKNDFRIEMLPQGVLRKAAIKNLILSALEDAKQAKRGGDLLIGVIKPPSSTPAEDAIAVKSSYEYVIDVLTEISEEFSLGFHDLIPSENRREVPEVGAIRLVSLQNIRGLSASHVIIFDLFQLEKWAEGTGKSLRPPLINLGYIALSRSKASTTVVLENADSSRIEPFLYELLIHATEMAMKVNE